MSKDRVIAIAKAEVGYLEKATNYNLDSKTGNAGSQNWTKYARDLYAAGYYNGNKNGYAWCDVFVDWCFFKAYGSKTKAEAVECQIGTLGAGCEYSLAYYRNAGRFSQTPLVGDQIFFKDSSTVYTIEGNPSGASGVVSNGGGVAMKSYAIGYSRIAGYGHPRYDVATATGTVTETPTTDYTTKTLAYYYPWRKYRNGSTPEPVYKDTDFGEMTGSLNPGEECYCTGRYGDAYCVLYQVDGYADRWAVGYVGYHGGVA